MIIFMGYAGDKQLTWAKVVCPYDSTEYKITPSNNDSIIGRYFYCSKCKNGYEVRPNAIAFGEY